MVIQLKVFEQTLSIIDTKSVPRKGSKDYLVLQFTFSSDWKDLNKLCYLQRDEVSQPIEVVDGLVEVPEWFTEQDSFNITLLGTNGGQEVPTNVVYLHLEKSNTLWEKDAPEPQPSWLAKVIDLNNHPPIPGDNGYWLMWDINSGAYVESELQLPAVSVGPSGGSVPKPLTFDYMPEGYPTKSVQTTTLMEEQEVAFTLSEEAGVYMAQLTNSFEIVDGQTYTIKWDGTEYECVGVVFQSQFALGNLSIAGEGDDTGEPFLYVYNTKHHTGLFGTPDTAASHTISVKTTVETVTPIDEKYLPENLATKADVENVQITAENAQITAENAQTTAENAKATANNAKATADEALPKTGGAVSGNLTVDAKNNSYRTVISSGEMALQYVNRSGTADDMVVISGRLIPSIVAGKDGPSGFKLSDSGLSLGYTSNDKDGIHLYHENGSSTAGTIVIQHTNSYNQAKERISIASTGRIVCNNSLKFDCGSEIEVVQTFGETGGSAIILQSSTANSTKRFRITVDDSGTLKATEVT